MPDMPAGQVPKSRGGESMQILPPWILQPSPLRAEKQCRVPQVRIRTECRVLILYLCDVVGYDAYSPFGVGHISLWRHPGSLVRETIRLVLFRHPNSDENSQIFDYQSFCNIQKEKAIWILYRRNT